MQKTKKIKVKIKKNTENTENKENKQTIKTNMQDSTMNAI